MQSPNPLAREVFAKLKEIPMTVSGYVIVPVSVMDANYVVKQIEDAPMLDLPSVIPYESSISSDARVLRIDTSNGLKFEYYWLA